MYKIGVIGCGTIGGEICRAIDRGTVSADLVGVCDADPAALKRISGHLRKNVAFMGRTELISVSELVVEATCREAAPEIIRESLQNGRSVLVLSVGGLLPHITEFQGLAREKKCFIYVPSGAIAGLDAVKGAREGEIHKATLTTRKPPKGLAGAPYVVDNNLDLMNLKKATLIFSGSALDAVPAFPANINVAAALSLAGIGPEKTAVNIIADPDCDRNTHEITVEGSFGKMVTRTELLTAPHNPKTSLLASLSAIALLRRITSFIVVGT